MIVLENELRQAVKEGKTVRQLCLEEKLLPEDELDRLLDPRSMLSPDEAS
jgi:fumarate hydratase class II